MAGAILSSEMCVQEQGDGSAAGSWEDPKTGRLEAESQSVDKTGEKA